MDDVVMSLEREAGMPEHVNQVGVGFCLHPLEDTAKSEEAGRPIYKDVEYIQIIIPGDRESVVFQPATADHKRRFPVAYARFKAQEAVAIVGTPIEAWPAITRALALTLKAAGIPTVDAMAEVGDGNLDRLGPGMRELRAKAKGWVAQAIRQRRGAKGREGKAGSARRDRKPAGAGARARRSAGRQSRRAQERAEKETRAQGKAAA
jgi:hypothetical protein